MYESNQFKGNDAIIGIHKCVLFIQVRRLGGFGGFGRTPPLPGKVRSVPYSQIIFYTCLACIKKITEPLVVKT